MVELAGKSALLDAEGQESLELLQARTGGFSLRVRTDTGSQKTLHSLYDPVGEAKRMADAVQFDGNGMLVVLGLGLGYHVLELANRFPEALLVVVEASPSVFELAKRWGLEGHVVPRVQWIVGRSAKDAVREITRLQLKAGMVPMCVFPLSSAVSAFSRYYDPLVETLHKSVSVRMWDRLRYPKFRQEPFGIALIDFNYFLTREVSRALQAIGHRVVRIPVSREQDGEQIVERCIAEIIESKPDFILTINHLGFDEDGVLTSFFTSIEMPVASWYVDSPDLILKPFPENVSPFTSVFVWDRSYMGSLKTMGFEYVSYLPLATDEKVFRPIRNGRAMQNRYGCQVGFVGNSMLGSVEKYRSRVRPAYRSLVDAIAESMHVSRLSLDRLLETLDEEKKSLLADLDKKEWMDFEAAVLWRATMLYRLACLQTLESLELTVCGDDGWERLLPKEVRRLPPLDYYRELPRFYNACRVNLNATSRQMGQAVNQRVFDVPACGGFLLTDHQTALPELFDVGDEIVVYREREEIPELGRYYLHNAKARKAVADKGRARVLGEHTYRKRIAAVISTMKERYS